MGYRSNRRDHELCARVKESLFSFICFRFPFVAVSIGLVINKSSVVGVVYNPILEELFHAVRGKGAFRNNERISVSTVKHIHECVVATNIGYDRTPEGIDFITGFAQIMWL